MKNLKAANRYAKSLLDLAIERGQLEDVFNDISGVSKTVAESRDLQLLLQSPILSQTQNKKC